jgi:molybdopterin molybdotransferase
MVAFKKRPNSSAKDASPKFSGAGRTPVQEALNLCLADQNRPMPGERVPVCEALGRVLRENVISRNPFPPFSKSLVDGYAVRCSDADDFPGSQGVCLKVKGRVAAGDSPGTTLAPGETVRIMTGAPIPEGTARVVKAEAVIDSGDTVYLKPAMHDNPYILAEGSDFKADHTLLGPGAIVKPADIAMMAACGCQDVLVSKRPRIGLVSIGNEIVSIGDAKQPGQTWDVVGPLLSALSAQAGATIAFSKTAADSVAEILETVMQASDCDILILIGGMANGDFDLTRQALKRLGIPNRLEDLDIVSIRRLFFGRYTSRAVWALSGPATAVMTNFLLLIRPLIDHMLAKSECGLKTEMLPLLADFQTAGSHKRFLPGLLKRHQGQTLVSIIEEQRFGHFSPMHGAEVLVELPEHEQQLKAGQTVKVYYID